MGWTGALIGTLAMTMACSESDEGAGNNGSHSAIGNADEESGSGGTTSSEGSTLGAGASSGVGASSGAGATSNGSGAASGTGSGGGSTGVPDDPGLTCEAAEKLCAENCVDPMSDDAHCGDCNQACERDTSCIEGECKLTYCGPTESWDEAWIALELEILEIVNQRRSEGATCDGDYYPPAPLLQMESSLRCAARMHSRDMSDETYFFSHDNEQGEEPADRVLKAGREGYGGENISAGRSTAEATMAGWMASPGHCRNIMNANHTVIGVGYAWAPPQFDVEPYHYGHYWTQVFD